MAHADHLEILRTGVESWNRWRDRTNHAPVDLSGADLSGRNLNRADLLRADLSGATLTRTQFEHAHLTSANLTGAVIERANFEHAVARYATFDRVRASDANFEVSTLRGASFREAQLAKARFHRAYLRDTRLTGADLSDTELRFAVLEGTRCEEANFEGADLRFASLVGADLSGARLVGVQAYGISAWGVRTDEKTQQDLIVSVAVSAGEAPLRTNDLRTAQLLALLLDGSGVRRVLDSVASKLVLILGSFAEAEKSVLDSLREELQRHGYVAVTFDFERPSALDYAETVTVLAGLSRFVVADFTNAREVRSEILQVRRQYPRVPVIPIARTGAQLPLATMVNAFPEEPSLLVRYDDVADLLRKLKKSVLDVAERRAEQIAETLARAEQQLRRI